MKKPMTTTKPSTRQKQTSPAAVDQKQIICQANNKASIKWTWNKAEDFLSCVCVWFLWKPNKSKGKQHRNSNKSSCLCTLYILALKTGEMCLCVSLCSFSLSKTLCLWLYLQYPHLALTILSPLVCVCERERVCVCVCALVHTCKHRMDFKSELFWHNYFI